MKESREERFRRVAEARVNKLIRMIRLLGNCSNRSVYAYTMQQVEQVFTRLQTELTRAHARYAGTARNHFCLAESDTATEEIHVTLPDGTVLSACGHTMTDYPTIQIFLTNPDGSKELLCFAEYNPGRNPGHELHVGAYQSHQDDTTYYEPYMAERNTNG